MTSIVLLDHPLQASERVCLLDVLLGLDHTVEVLVQPVFLFLPLDVFDVTHCLLECFRWIVVEMTVL